MILILQLPLVVQCLKIKPAMLDLIIRLGQTMAEDGLPVLDRKTILDFVPISNKKQILEHFAGLGQQQEQVNQQQAEGEEIKQIVGELTTAVQEISKEIQRLAEEHENIMQELKENEMKGKAFEKGVKQGKGEMQDDEKMFLEKLNEVNPDEEEVNSAMSGDIPDEVLDEINNMSDEELQALFRTISST